MRSPRFQSAGNLSLPDPTPSPSSTPYILPPTPTSANPPRPPRLCGEIPKMPKKTTQMGVCKTAHMCYTLTERAFTFSGRTERDIEISWCPYGTDSKCRRYRHSASVSHNRICTEQYRLVCPCHSPLKDHKADTAHKYTDQLRLGTPSLSQPPYAWVGATLL